MLCFTRWIRAGTSKVSHSRVVSHSRKRRSLFRSSKAFARADSRCSSSQDTSWPNSALEAQPSSSLLQISSSQVDMFFQGPSICLCWHRVTSASTSSPGDTGQRISMPSRRAKPTSRMTVRFGGRDSRRPSSLTDCTSPSSDHAGIRDAFHENPSALAKAPVALLGILLHLNALRSSGAALASHRRRESRLAVRVGSVAFG